MKSIKNLFLLYTRETGSVMRAEFREILADKGVMLVLIFAIFIYSILYGLGYKNEVLRNVPIAVVDNSNTNCSRQLINTFNAGCNTYVAYKTPDMIEAKSLFDNHKINGIVYIPADYETELESGRQANVSIYCDASYFLMYRQVFQEIVASVQSTGAMVELQRLTAKGVSDVQSKAISQPVIYQSHNLFNPYLGYGTYVMPAIMIVIIQQTALIGIGMIGGTWREYNLYRRLIPATEQRLSTIPVVLGKAISYCLIYTMTVSYIFTVHYHLFGYPINGTIIDCLAVLVPYIMACVFMAIAVSVLFTKREYSLLFLLWTSIPCLLLSGASLPREAFPDWLYTFGQILPSSNGIEAFIRVQTIGASAQDVMPIITRLWRQVVIYGGLALIGMHFTLNRNFASKQE